MILEGFEIENWNCIKKVSVSDLPPTGVVVIHGPNRSGKSSIVQALRACLMDFSSKTTALKSRFPRGTGEKPVVSVTFQVAGTSYRITKHFGSDKSELASKTSTGAWKVETTSAAEAHGRTRSLAGGNKSTEGLHQLLWLTQAEFLLPDTKAFDGNVQAQLRGILGVLQTPLDDRFIDRVKKRWNTWYSGQRKVGKRQEIKDACKLAENVTKLGAGRQELQQSEDRFVEVEGLLRRAADLELAMLDLNRQKEEQSGALIKCQEEHQKSETRIVTRQQAEKDRAAAERERTAALEEQDQRAGATSRLLEDMNAIEPAQNNVEAKGQSVNTMEEQQARQRSDLRVQRNQRRVLEERANRVAAKQRALEDTGKLSAAKDYLTRARGIADAVVGIETYLIENPTPGKDKLEALKANRQQVARLQSERDAASMNLTIMQEEGAGAAQLSVDGGPLRELPAALTPTVNTVRRRADLLISGWGRVEWSRGTGQGDLDQIEEDLRRCHDDFANAVAPLGIAGNDPDALDELIRRDAEHRLKTPELGKQKEELKKLAPKGFEPLKTRVLELQTKLKDVPGTDPTGTEPLPAERGELDLLTSLQEQIETVDGDIDRLESEAELAKSGLDQARRDETAAKTELAARKATANGRREELERLRTEEQVSERIQSASEAVVQAESKLQQTELSNDELTIDVRLTAVEQAVRALEHQIREDTKKYHEIKGRLTASEGLHAHRSTIAARVDELTRLTQQESLEKDAVDRLYALFEECREKQLGTLMGPIHDRVLAWMRILDIGDYKEVRFNEAFLPDKLMSRDGTAEFAIGEESTGAQEQIGMLVRLALGSLLASSVDPGIAILDDPLTHCDIGRLNTMRTILRRAAEGDPKSTPKFGPLQIVILTCHPEWFRDERATVIDLESANVMRR